MWLKNSKGRPDAMLTCAIVSLAVVLAKFLVSGVTVNWGGHTIAAGTLDASLAGAILLPTFGAYWGRKHTDANTRNPEKPV